MLDMLLDGMWAYWVIALIAFLLGLWARRILDWLESLERKIVVEALLGELELASKEDIEAALRKVTPIRSR